MARINVDGLGYKALIELQSNIEVAIAARKTEDGKALKAQLAELAEKSGFSMEELFGKGGKTSKIAVKFRNPKAPQETWTGRGRKPNWMVAALKKGAKIESFAV
jgi:DNA-binding protein H-NS